MKKLVVLNFAVILNLVSMAASAESLQVFACEPEWAALVKEVGGDRVDVFSATHGLQDPHHIEAKPSLIVKARKADLLICSGAELEIGWLPIILAQSRNSKIQPGQVGSLYIADTVELLEKDTKADRGEGDVHPGGNPHVQLDPRRLLRVAQAITGKLITLDADGAAFYTQRSKDFDLRWQKSIVTWQQRASPLKGMKVISHHKILAYLYDWLGMQEIATLEPKPGVPPSAGHLSSLLNIVSEKKPRCIVRATFEDDQAARWLSDKTQLPVVVLPMTVGGDKGVDDLFQLFDSIINRMLVVVK